MELIHLGEAKNYLRVDLTEDDELISGLLDSAIQLVSDVARLTTEEQSAVFNTVPEESDEPELVKKRTLIKTAVLYTLAYFYEHRESANHHDLTLTLRAMLHAIREGRDFG